MMASLLALPLSAQNTSDGSIYSRYGLGELRSFTSAQLQGMGGGGTALRSYTNLNFSNPATWADQLLTRVSAGMLYENLEASDASNQTSRLVSGSFQGLHFGFPILSNKLGFAFGMIPYSGLSYRVELDGSLEPTDAGLDSTDYVVNFKGNGGLQQIVGGFGYRVNRYLSVGANLNFLFGIVEENRITSFESTAYRESNLTNSTRFSGLTATFGLNARLPKLAREDDFLAIGATLTLPANLNGTRVRTIDTNAEVADTLGGEIDGFADLPLSLGLGVAYHPSARWSMLVDFRYEPWTQFDSDFDFPGFTPNGPNSLDDRIRISGGIEFLPAGRDLLAPYFQRVFYRLGAYYDQSYITPDAAVNLRTIGVTGGVSLPTLIPSTRLELNFEYGRRGTTDRGLVRDQFFKVGANINFGERWFAKRKLG